RTSSPALEADSRDALIDTLATLAVLLSLVAAWLGHNIDLWATLVIVLFIVYTSAELGVGAIRVLLDASIERELLNKVQRTLEADRDVVEVHELKGRNSGPYRFIEGHVVLDVDDLEQAHQISYRLESAVRDIAENIDRVLLHFEPEHKETLLYAVPMQSGDLIADDFGQSEKFALVTVGADDRRVRDVRYLDNPYADAGSGRGILIAHMLRDEDVDAVFVRKELEGKGPYYALAAEHVRTIRTEAESLAEALARESIELEVPLDAGAES
ncbi:MAG: cation diffusion facilitator family transporter, partial [Armatimonadota bacterium]